MNDVLITILEYLIDSAVVGLVVGFFALWLSHMRFKVHVAEHYTKSTTVETVYQDIAVIRTQLSELLSLVHELKGRINGK